MSMRERVFAYTDRPMTWARAIMLGTFVWVLLIALTGQLPSWIIYWVDANQVQIIETSGRLPLINDEGLNAKQILIIRDIVANSVQMGALTVILVFAYYWQKSKLKRTGAKGLSDPVKGYMSGK